MVDLVVLCMFSYNGSVLQDNCAGFVSFRSSDDWPVQLVPLSVAHSSYPDLAKKYSYFVFVQKYLLYFVHIACFDCFLSVISLY